MYRLDYRLLTTTKGLEIIKKNCKDELLLEKIENADIKNSAGEIVYLGWNRLNNDRVHDIENLLYELEEQDITYKTAIMGENFDDVSTYKYVSSKDKKGDIPTPDISRVFNDDEINNSLQKIKEKTKLSEFETIEY